MATRRFVLTIIALGCFAAAFITMMTVAFGPQYLSSGEDQLLSEDMQLTTRVIVSSLFCESLLLSADHPFLVFHLSEKMLITPTPSANNRNLRLNLTMHETAQLQYFLLPGSLMTADMCSNNPGASFYIARGNDITDSCLSPDKESMIPDPCCSDEGHDENPCISKRNPGNTSRGITGILLGEYPKISCPENYTGGDNEDSLDFEKSLELEFSDILVKSIDEYDQDRTARENKREFTATNDVLKFHEIPARCAENVDCGFNLNKTLQLKITEPDIYFLVVRHNGPAPENSVSIHLSLNGTVYGINYDVSNSHICDGDVSSFWCVVPLPFLSGDRIFVKMPAESIQKTAAYKLKYMCISRISVDLVLLTSLPITFILMTAAVLNLQLIVRRPAAEEFEYPSNIFHVDDLVLVDPQIACTVDELRMKEMEKDFVESVENDCYMEEFPVYESTADNGIEGTPSVYHDIESDQWSSAQVN